MVFFFEYGRLGNQLFQYVGIRRKFPNQKIIFMGCKDLKETMDNIDAVFVSRDGAIVRKSIWLLERFLNLLAALRILSSSREVRNNGEYFFDDKVGLLPWVTVLFPSFFQHEKINRALKPDFILKPHYIERASKWLGLPPSECENSTKIFVQIRRGDYLNWPNSDFPAVVGISWFRKTMDHFRKRFSPTLFVIVTDDPWYAEDLFADESDVVISRNNVHIDLAIMSLCDHGILSPSSFAWWGAWFSRKFSSNPTGSEYFAPKFWGGHRCKKWLPEGFKTYWITYTE